MTSEQENQSTSNQSTESTPVDDAAITVGDVRDSEAIAIGNNIIQRVIKQYILPMPLWLRVVIVIGLVAGLGISAYNARNTGMLVDAFNVTFMLTPTPRGTPIPAKEGETLVLVADILMEPCVDDLSCNVMGLCTTLFNIGFLYWRDGGEDKALDVWVEAYRIASQINYAQGLDALEELAGQLPFEEMGLSPGLDGWAELSARMGE
ncbi:MAG: hypothetical protein AAF639_14280 [Chloroflexota bacterium]